MPRVHEVTMGESTTSVAFRYGFFPGTLWDHSDNSELRQLRDDPDVLAPGDFLSVPDLRIKEVEAAIDKAHKYRRKGVPAMFRVRLLDAQGEPVANEPYELKIEDKTLQGKTDAEGRVKAAVSPDVASGKLTLTNTGRVYEFEMGHLHPVETLSGLRARLNNLGFHSPDSQEITPPLRQAIRRFQKTFELPITGEGDTATMEKLVEVHKG